MDSNIHTTDDPMLTEQNAPGLTLPKWFLVVITGVAGFFAVTYVPWSVWVTLRLLSAESIFDARAEVLSDYKVRLAALEVSRENHALQLQAIASSRFTAEQAHALNQGTLAEIRAVSSEVKQLQRDFDRNFGKVKPRGEAE